MSSLHTAHIMEAYISESCRVPACTFKLLFFKKMDIFDSGIENECEFKINEKFARKYEHNKKRQELEQLQQKYGTRS